MLDRQEVQYVDQGWTRFALHLAQAGNRRVNDHAFAKGHALHKARKLTKQLIYTNVGYKRKISCFV